MLVRAVCLCVNFTTENITHINDSLHLAGKKMLGYYLFLVGNTSPRAKLEENCELRAQQHLLSQMEAVDFIVLQVSFATREIF